VPSQVALVHVNPPPGPRNDVSAIAMVGSSRYRTVTLRCREPVADLDLKSFFTMDTA